MCGIAAQIGADRAAGKRGTKTEVLAWIEGVWTGTRPKSLRERMEQMWRDDEG